MSTGLPVASERWCCVILPPQRKHIVPEQPAESNIYTHHHHHHLSQPSRLGTPRPPKLQPRPIHHPHDPAPQRPPFTPQYKLRKRIPPRSKIPKHNLQLPNLPSLPLIVLIQHRLILDQTHNVRPQLVRRIVAAARRLLEPNVAGREGDDRIAVAGREGDVAVVAGREDVEVVGTGDGRAGEGGASLSGDAVWYDRVVRRTGESRWQRIGDIRKALNGRGVGGPGVGICEVVGGGG